MAEPEPHCSGATVTSERRRDGYVSKPVAKALGDYAGAMPPSVLASGNDHDRTSSVDKRFVVVPDVGRNVERGDPENHQAVTLFQ